MAAKSALVLGATGGVGGAIAGALIARGWSVCGLARDVSTAERGWPKHRGAIMWAAGDAMRHGDVIGEAAGVSVIVHALNPPGYRHRPEERRVGTECGSTWRSRWVAES